MDKVIAVLNKTAETFRALTSVGLALLATAVIVQVLFGANAPFIPVDVIVFLVFLMFFFFFEIPNVILRLSSNISFFFFSHTCNSSHAFINFSFIILS